MDPWEACQWVAIFRLIIPDALFRLCGGRNENLGDGEFQKLAVKAGLNGVMMGNFLTTLGSEPEWDRQMFEELGLNVARQEDNGANPRPDNRSGWLEGETPRTPVDELIDSQAGRQLLEPLDAASPQEEDVRAASAGRCPERLPRADPRGARRMTSDIQDRLDEIRNKGLYRRMRCVSGPQGPRVLLDGKPVLLLCSNNYLGLADHPRVREAAAEAAMRYGAGSGASRLISGNMTIHRRLEEQLAAFKHSEACLLFGSGYLANAGVVSALAREGDVVFSDALNHASIVDGCRLSRAETFVYDHCDTDHLEWGLREAEGRGSLIVTDGVFSMDGDVAPLERIVELAQRYDARVMVDEAHGTGAIGPDGRGRRGRGGAGGRGRRDRRHARQGARLLRRLRVLRPADGEVPDQHRAHADLLDRAAAPGGGGCDGGARACCASNRAGWRSSSATRRCSARRLRSRACRCRRPPRRSCRWSSAMRPRP